MELAELQTFIGDLTNDPPHDRYSLTQINQELDNEQNKWNVQAKILKDTVSISVTAGTRQYALSNLTGTPISFPRATLAGIPLEKTDKTTLDLYATRNWTEDTGTPDRYFIETTDPDVQYVTLYRTPVEDATAVIEYVKAHTSMSASTDEPFNSSPLVVPYHWGLGYGVASRLLLRDPSAVNSPKIPSYNQVAKDVLADVIQVFKALERAEPMRIRMTHRPVRGLYT